MNSSKKKILIITGRYLPGYKDGGPVRSIKNLTDFLGNEYDFNILTCDRDHGDIKPYENIKVNEWNRLGNANVYYVPPKSFKFSVIKRLANDTHLVYVCGCFSDYAINTLILKRFNKIKKPVVVAAMGLFMPNALKKKPLKYKIFIKTFKILELFRNIYWSATTEYEGECIKAFVDKNAKCFIAEDLPRVIKDYDTVKNKSVGELNVAFLSRISPEKNLIYAIKILKNVKANIKFTIYGPIYDKEYWGSCEEELKKLPHNIQWKYMGNVDSEMVVETIKQHHIFLFPTLGENYGHVIQEFLSAGCPCVLSDQTPWLDLEYKGAGYVINLENKEKFVRVIEEYAYMDSDMYNTCANRAFQYAVENSNNKVKNTGYRQIFDMRGNL